MIYVRATQDGIVLQYPYSFEQLRRDNPQVSFPRQPSNELLANYNAYPVTPVAQPAASDPITKDVVEVNPTLISNVWTQTWGEVDVSAQEAIDRQESATDIQQRATVKADSFVAQFIAMTPQEVNTYVDNNTANLAAMRTLVKRMALMLLLLARNKFQ